MKLFICILLLISFIVFSHSKPTIYKKNYNDKLEPLLIAVSSTVIPLPVYKVGVEVGVGGLGKKPTKPDEATKLITFTGYKKKVSPKESGEESINIKQITKEEYEKQKHT